MNIATVVLAVVVATLFVLALRYLRVNGMCSACEDKQACEAAQRGVVGTASGRPHPSTWTGGRLATLRGCPSCGCAAACPLSDPSAGSTPALIHPDPGFDAPLKPQVPRR